MKNNLIDNLIKKYNIDLNKKNVKLFIQIFKFIIVGGIVTILDWILYYILYNYLKISPLVANIISFSISTIYNYWASTKWVFDVNKNKSRKKLFIEFVLFSAIALGLTELLLWIGIEVLLMNAMLSKIVATIIVMVFNFITRKMFLE